jgi:hypothetical protein
MSDDFVMRVDTDGIHFNKEGETQLFAECEDGDYVVLDLPQYDRLRAEVERVREQRNALRVRLQGYAGEVQRAMYRATSTIEQLEKEHGDE